MSKVYFETPILWPPDVNSWLTWKDPDAGKDWRLEEKGTTEDEMAGWHHWLDGRESEWTPGVGYGQGGLACCNSWGCKESDTTEWLNWTELKVYFSDIKTKGKKNYYSKGESINDANVREVKRQLMGRKQVKKMFKSRHLPFRKNSAQSQIPIFSCKLEFQNILKY